jgi:aspartyl-tRNA(Asn)/glutamyl-tRNA(Gln) amidotransferase subunit A
MAGLTPDPLAADDIAGYGDRLRRGETTAEATTEAYLERIAALDPKLGAFEYVAAEQARSAARSIDKLLAAGTDLGPLMGVPVAVKDLFAVEGMPTTAGSNVDVSDTIGPEGTFVKSLKQTGCVILGKTKTVEFALGGAGTNFVRGTPWNPWDTAQHRAPGGSSSGSAVAVAAGLSAFAIGSDTGGSVRGPAAFCGVFGLKTTVGLWPTDGVFPLSRTLDTIGPLTRSAADGAIVFAALSGQATVAPMPCQGLRLGKPAPNFFEDLDEDVERCSTAMIMALTEAGAEIIDVDVPEVAELSALFAPLSACELIAVLGRERFLAERDKMDPVVAGRAALGLETTADTYIRLLWRHRDLCRIMDERMEGLDGWITPTRSTVALPVTDYDTSEAGIKTASKTGLNTRPGNLFGFCGTSTPIHALGSELPVGFQVMCPAGAEERVLAIARTLEDIVGVPTQPDVSPFL